MHKMAQDLVGPGVVAFTGEFSVQFDDEYRTDMIISHTNGGYVRIHPGWKIHFDATPKFFSPAQEEIVGATEHAFFEWNTPGHGVILTWESAETIPQRDRLNTISVWAAIEKVWQPWGVTLDITDGRILCWRLWICNLGADAPDIIGPGVLEARVCMMPRSATFTFERIDGSSRQVVLVLSRGRHQELNIHVP